MDREPAIAPTDVRKTLERARSLSKAIRNELSIDLESVFDPYSCRPIPSWRNNGSIADHPLHRMMSRVGGFPASLARYLISAYSQPGEIVVDPFCGKGTTLLEAIVMGRRAMGGDIAPDAVIVSRAKCANVSFAQVANYIQDLDAGRIGSLRGVSDDVRVFFSPTTLRQILSIRTQVLGDMQGSTKRSQVATFVCGVILGILHGHSQVSLSLPCNQCFAMSANYVRRYVAQHSLKRPDRDVKKCLLAKSMELLPHPEHPAHAKVYEIAAEHSIRYTQRYLGHVSLILTSPPYLDRQTYVKDSWLRLWFLGRDRSAIAEHSLETGNIFRFLQGMRASLSAFVRMLKPGGTAALVCGRATRTTAKKTESIRISDLCLLALREVNERRTVLSVDKLIHDRVALKRGSYFAVHAGKNGHAGKAGGRRFGEEEILILKKALWDK